MTFEDHVRAALDELPPSLASGLQQPRRRRRGRAPRGSGPVRPLPRGSATGARRHGRLLPDKISIYRLPLEEAFPTPSELREEIRITVLHELAHYFGLDEDRIADLGYD